MRLASGIAQGEVTEQHSWYAAVFNDVLGACHDHGRYPVCLEVPGDKAKRLVTDWAVGHQDSRINPVFFAPPKQLRAIHLDGVTLTSIGRRTMKTPCQFANFSFGFGLSKQRQRKPGAAVGHGGVFAINRDMRDAKIVILARVAGVDLIELGSSVVRRARTLISLGRVKR